MHEADAAGEAVASLLVDKLNPIPLEPVEVALDVVGLEADVMKATLLFEEVGYAGAFADWLQQFELAAAELQERGADTLLLHHTVNRRLQSEDALVKAVGVVDAGDDDADVVNALDQRRMPMERASAMAILGSRIDGACIYRGRSIYNLDTGLVPATGVGTTRTSYPTPVSFCPKKRPRGFRLGDSRPHSYPTDLALSIDR